MRHVVRIRIRNFQSHADTTMQLHAGVNAITGPSDNGKTAILRALRWCLWNVAPDGEWMRKGCTMASVEVTMSDGATVLRERRSGRNRYAITLPGLPVLELADFGRDCPVEVLQAHGMRPVGFDPEKPALLNLATQLEAPFFLSDPAPMRARILGRLAGVHVIDAAIKGANRDLQAIVKDSRTQEQEITRLDQQLQAYVDLDDLEVRITRAEQLLGQVQPLSDRMERLTALRVRLAELGTQLTEVAETLHRLRHTEAAAAALAGAETSDQRYRHLMELRDILDLNELSMSLAAGRLEQFRRRMQAEPHLVQAELNESRCQNLQRLWSALRAVNTGVTAAETVLRSTVGAEAAADAFQGAWRASDTLARLQTARGVLSWSEASLATLRTTIVTTQRQGEAAASLTQVNILQFRLDTLTGLETRLDDFDGRLAKGRGVVAGIEIRIEDAGQQYGQALQEAKVCPTCLQVIDPTTAAQIAATMTGEVCEHV